LVLSYWVSFVVGVVVVVNVTTVEGSLCYYTYANQQSQDRRSWEKQNQMGE
jgi:hypothetical protein